MPISNSMGVTLACWVHVLFFNLMYIYSMSHISSPISCKSHSLFQKSSYHIYITFSYLLSFSVVYFIYSCRERLQERMRLLFHIFVNNTLELVHTNICSTHYENNPFPFILWCHLSKCSQNKASWAFNNLSKKKDERYYNKRLH